MKRSKKARTFLHAFTLIELLVVVTIIALLVAILLPALEEARKIAKNAVCMVNVRSIGQACMVYATAHEATIPVLDEAPQWNLVHGPRGLPLILRDEGILPINDDRGGV